MKQKHADSPSAFLAAAMAVAGAAMLLCPLIGQNTEMNQSAAEYDDLRVQLTDIAHLGQNSAGTF